MSGQPEIAAKYFAKAAYLEPSDKKYKDNLFSTNTQIYAYPEDALLHSIMSAIYPELD